MPWASQSDMPFPAGSTEVAARLGRHPGRPFTPVSITAAVIPAPVWKLLRLTIRRYSLGRGLSAGLALGSTVGAADAALLCQRSGPVFHRAVRRRRRSSGIDGPRGRALSSVNNTARAITATLHALPPPRHTVALRCADAHSANDALSRTMTTRVG